MQPSARLAAPPRSELTYLARAGRDLQSSGVVERKREPRAAGAQSRWQTLQQRTLCAAASNFL